LEKGYLGLKERLVSLVIGLVSSRRGLVELRRLLMLLWRGLLGLRVLLSKWIRG
jgi:hypothetical protein